MIINLNPKYRTYVTLKEQNKKLQWDLLDQQNCSYPYNEQIRIKKQLFDNIEFIKDKNIIDLGTYIGIFLDAMCQLGCKSVVGTDIRQETIDLTNEAIFHAGHKNAQIVYNDIYDFNSLKYLLSDIDTIHLSGLIYHITHHFELLTFLTQNSKANAIIIDTLYWLPNWYENEPKITFKVEDSRINNNAVTNVLKQVNTAFVGVPNLKWFIDTLSLLNWKIKNIDYVTYLGLTGTEGKVRRRAIITAYR